VFVMDKYKAAYLHINKTAGTSIKQHLSDLIGPENMRQMGPTHHPLETAGRFLGNRISSYRILVSIRNPYARLMSIYLFRKTRFQDGDESATTQAAYELPLKQWFMEVVLESQRLTDLSITDSMLVGGELPKNVHTVSVETLNRDLSWFCEDVLGIKTKERPPHLNKTKYDRDHYTKYFDAELTKAVYEWDRWVIDEYYPWII
jgi:hypothetical protein